MTKFQISLIKTIIMLVYTAIKMVKQLMVEKPSNKNEVDESAIMGSFGAKIEESVKEVVEVMKLSKKKGVAIYFRALMSCYETGRDFEDDPLIDFT